MPADPVESEEFVLFLFKVRPPMDPVESEEWDLFKVPPPAGISGDAKVLVVVVLLLTFDKDCTEIGAETTAFMIVNRKSRCSE
jgi:hypothetical protein